MNREQLKKLREEITLNSLFTSDYVNSFGIDEKLVHIFMEGYFEELNEILKETIGEEFNNLNDNEYYKKVFELDTLDNLENYYNSVENVGF